MEILSSAIGFAKEKLAVFDAGHDWNHIERVLKLARIIQKEESSGDRMIIELSAILHDIADTKFYKGSETDGGDMAYNFLLENGLNEDNARHIKEIINNISFKKHLDSVKINSIEFQIVQDADRLDAIGAIGIARAFHYGGYKNRALYDPDIPPMNYETIGEYLNSPSPTINHFYEKLLLLKSKMNTTTGKRLAEDRHAYMLNFIARFKSEWDGEI